MTPDYFPTHPVTPDYFPTVQMGGLRGRAQGEGLFLGHRGGGREGEGTWEGIQTFILLLFCSIFIHNSDNLIHALNDLLPRNKRTQ